MRSIFKIKRESIPRVRVGSILKSANEIKETACIDLQSKTYAACIFEGQKERQVEFQQNPVEQRGRVRCGNMMGI